MKFKAFRETVTQVTKEVDNFPRACPRGYCPRASDLFPSRGLCPALRSPIEPERETICNRVNSLFFCKFLYENLVSNSRGRTRANRCPIFNERERERDEIKKGKKGRKKFQVQMYNGIS